MVVSASVFFILLVSLPVQGTQTTPPDHNPIILPHPKSLQKSGPPGYFKQPSELSLPPLLSDHESIILAPIKNNDGTQVVVSVPPGTRFGDNTVKAPAPAPGLYPVTQTTDAFTPEGVHIIILRGQHVRIESPHTHAITTDAMRNIPLEFEQRIMYHCWLSFNQQLQEVQQKWGKVEHEDFADYIAQCTAMLTQNWIAGGRKDMTFRPPPLIWLTPKEASLRRPPPGAKIQRN